MNAQDDFYIGYEGGIPPRTRGAVAVAVVAALAAGITAATVFVSQQRGLADARFEYGNVRTFEGYLSLTPVPVLVVTAGERPGVHWLVGPGKFGPGAALGGAAAGWVSLSGTLVERELWRMIEVVPGSVGRLDASAPPPLQSIPPAQQAVLRGEIVDSKCYLGVMIPGEGTVHRDCAMRCLAGDVPPMFAFQDGSGSRLALLLGADADTLRRGVAQTTTLSGMLSGPEEALVFTLGEPR